MASERDTEGFDIDEEFLAEQAEDPTDYDRILNGVDKRVRSQPGPKRGKAAWSRLEEVLADRKLEKDLREILED